MSKNRLNTLFAIVAMAIVVVAGFFLGVQPQLAQAASNRDQQVDVDRANATSTVELARLEKQSKDLPAMRAQLAKLQKSMPASASMASFYQELNGVAAGPGVTVASITTADAVAYTPPAAAAAASGAATPTATASATPTATDSGDPTPVPTPSASPTTPTVFTDPAITSSNLSMIPVTVSVNGSFEQALQFVKGVQGGERLFLVNAISSAASSEAATEGDGSSASGTTWTFGGYVYVLTTETSTSAKG